MSASLTVVPVGCEFSDNETILVVKRPLPQEGKLRFRADTRPETANPIIGEILVASDVNSLFDKAPSDGIALMIFVAKTMQFYILVLHREPKEDDPGLIEDKLTAPGRLAITSLD